MGPPTANQMVLVVEDAEATRRRVAGSLMIDGFNVIQREDGESGLEAAKNEVPDAIILDIALPGIDGWQVFELLRSDVVTKGIPVVVVTAHYTAETRSRADFATADAFVGRPFDLNHLRKAVASHLGEQRREAASSVLRQATDLEHRVDDPLVAAKAEMGELPVGRVPVSLFAQTAQVLEMYGENAAGIEVSGAKVRALGDPARVRQILRDLITNALRYGGERIRVEVVGNPGTATVRVVDNGRGIPEEDRERVFEPRQRVGAKPGLTAALGLGLTISHQLAQLMGGDPVYRYDGESTCELSLPVSK